MLNIFFMNDPVISLARFFGFPITFYKLEPTNWVALIRDGPGIFVFYIFLVMLVMLAAKSNNTPARVAWALGIISLLLYFPLWYGQTKLYSIDVVLPCIGFLGTLNLIDILFIKTAKERADWGFREYCCHLVTLPVDKPTGKNPRITALKRLFFVWGKLALNTIVMYAVPPPDEFARLHGLKLIAYSGAAGVSIYALLGGLIEGWFVIISLICGIEMKPMFMNPLMAGSIREFWARWNIAIKQGFHRAIFTLSQRLKEKPKGSSISRKPRNKYLSKTIHHNILSDTTTSTLSTSETNSDIPIKNDINSSITPRTMEKENKNYHKSSRFIKKALMAMMVFLASGIFHEYINFIAFRKITGENLAFFLINGGLTVLQVWIKSNVWPFKKYNLPYPIGWIMVLALVWVLSPLFVVPYIRNGFYEQAKYYALLGPTPATVWVFGYI